MPGAGTTKDENDHFHINDTTSNKAIFVPRVLCLCINNHTNMIIGKLPLNHRQSADSELDTLYPEYSNSLLRLGR